jgi:hypothetical protein
MTANQIETPEPATVRTDVGPVPIEQAIAVSLAKLRALAANCDTDDYYENWTREVLDRRPLALVAALMPWQNLVWVMEFDPESDASLSAEVSPHTFSTGITLDPGGATIDWIKGKLLNDIAGDVGWLVKEMTGEFPRQQSND